MYLLEYQDAFSLFDKKGDGMIGCDQVGEVLRALGLNPLAAEIRKLIKEIDSDGKLKVWYLLWENLQGLEDIKCRILLL